MITELEKILLFHAKKYPLMQCCDLVKLVYQNEFGGGHLISDPVSSEKRLQSELETVTPNPDIPLCENIGNGLCRVDLRAIGGKITPEKLNGIFVLSANTHKGNSGIFIKKLEILKKCFSSLSLGFEESELSEYLREYAGKGFPAVSHSEIYRKAYSPAYRVCLTELVFKNGSDILRKGIDK